MGTILIVEDEVDIAEMVVFLVKDRNIRDASHRGA